MNTRLKLPGSFLLCIFIFIGCGSEGDPGPQGELGAPGERGEKGDPGTANVMYSDWFTPSWNKADETSYKEHVISVDELTDDFIENGGVVLVYIKASYIEEDEEKTTVLPLPTTTDEFYAGFRLDMPNDLLIALSGMNQKSLPEPFNGAELRYILIPGGVNIDAGRVAMLDYTDYYAVKSYYSLPD